MARRIRIKIENGLVFGFVCLACASSAAFRIDAKYTPVTSAAAIVCRPVRPTYVVPNLPLADRVLGDWIVTCENGCPRDYALKALMQRAERSGASHVSALSCVQRGEGWQCIGRASVPQRCDKET